MTLPRISSAIRAARRPSLALLAAVLAAGPALAQDAPEDNVRALLRQMRANGLVTPQSAAGAGGVEAAPEQTVDALLRQMSATGVISPKVAEQLRRRAAERAAVARGTTDMSAPMPAEDRYATEQAQSPDHYAPVLPAPAEIPWPPALPRPVTAPLSGAAPVIEANAAPPPSDSMVVNLTRLLVQRGVITQDAADQLRQEAENDANKARATVGAPLVTAGAEPRAGVIRVPYVPQLVRDQIKADIKKDVLAQAQAEGWANPHSIPDWVPRVTLFGDFRFRDEFDLYSANNVSPYINYAAFNSSGPTDINANTNPNGLPYLDTRTNRSDQLSIRARLGLTANIVNGVSATFRAATGSDNGPVSTTQYLGGGLTKNNLWLDLAYVKLDPTNWAEIILGRQPNLYMHTTLLFSNDLNLDGGTIVFKRSLGEAGPKLSVVAGAYPIGYVGASFPTYSADKTADSTQWLFAGQIAVRYQPDPQSWSARGAVSLYDFANVAGQLSAPCSPWQNTSAPTECSTDESRPAFMQKGNTLFLIRDILPNPNNPLNYAEPQFVGLSYDYRELDVTGAFEFPVFGALRGLVEADYVRNLAYDPSRILSNSLTPPVTNFDQSGTYRSGPNGWLASFTVGYTHPHARGDWNVTAGYRYLQPDAAIDAFTDPNFYLGGTNNKGYFIDFNYYIVNNTWLTGRWASANEVLGPPLAIDVLQLELNTKF